ncbi:hypothetical protein ACVIOG_006395 [Rhizobium leguminosarum]
MHRGYDGTISTPRALHLADGILDKSRIAGTVRRIPDNTTRHEAHDAFWQFIKVNVRLGDIFQHRFHTRSRIVGSKVNQAPGRRIQSVEREDFEAIWLRRNHSIGVPRANEVRFEGAILTSVWMPTPEYRGFQNITSQFSRESLLNIAHTVRENFRNRVFFSKRRTVQAKFDTPLLETYGNIAAGKKQAAAISNSSPGDILNAGLVIGGNEVGEVHLIHVGTVARSID